MNRRLLGVALLLGILAVEPTKAEADPAAVLANLALQRRDAARRTYEVMWTNYRERRAQADTLYRWSVRWLEAEKQLAKNPAGQAAAFKEHWERMRDLDRLIRDLVRSRQVTSDEVSASEYYRVEAEVWYLQGQQEKKPR
jgi:hypothetical protein